MVPAPAQSGKPAPPGAIRPVALAIGLVVFALILVLPFEMAAPARRTAAIAALMAVWWLTEAVPIPVTALLPLVLFPALGVLNAADAAAPYANPIVFLFLGGFVVALAMQRWGLHRRIALGIVARVGTRPAQLIAGFMAATAFISMWVSNTATAAMMVPIGIALAELFRTEDRDAPFPFGTALMLGIAYSATLGGAATLIGTPPNAVFAATAQELLGETVSFAGWLSYGLPVTLIMLPLTWALLVYVLFPVGRTVHAGAIELLHNERRALGHMSRGEMMTMLVFAGMAIAWLLREPKVVGDVVIPGIATWAPWIDDSTIAIAGAILLFLLPGERGTRRPVLEWPAMCELPWGVLILFGGGLSLARGFEDSGLTALFGSAIASFAGAPDWVVIAAAVTLFVALSELASNTAIAAMGMPLLAATAEGLGHDPIPLMAAGALAASCAFMMPVGTPPNAIVFGSGYIRMRDMMRAGIVLNVIAIVVITALSA